VLLSAVRDFRVQHRQTGDFIPFQLTFARDTTLPLNATLLEADNQMDSSELREKELLMRATAADSIHKKQRGVFHGGLTK